MLYDIMNKNKVIGKLRWFYGEPVELIDIRLPSFIKKLGVDWVTDRTSPVHRANIRELLQRLGLNSKQDIIDFTKGLSLTDTFWVKTEGSSLKWEDINLYDNAFNETISKIAFDGGLYGINFTTTTPELATDGMLPKCWHREDNGIYLKKGGTSGYVNSGKEPISEYLASQVLDILGYKHVKYTLEMYRGKLVSSCKLVTNKSTSMIPIFYVLDRPNYSNLVAYCKQKGFLDDLYRMFIFDYLILNSDRHLRNIGILYDSDTYKIKGLAPIFDNGVGMLSYYVLGDSIEDYKANYRPRLYDNFEVYTRLFKSELGNRHNVNKLVDFKFKDSVLIKDKVRLKFIENFIRERAREFLSF